jgi:hypothetical protein
MHDENESEIVPPPLICCKPDLNSLSVTYLVVVVVDMVVGMVVDMVVGMVVDTVVDMVDISQSRTCLHSG